MSRQLDAPEGALDFIERENSPNLAAPPDEGKEARLMESLVSQLLNVDEGPGNAIAQELLGSEATGDSAYSAMSPEDQSVHNKYAFDYFNARYEDRDLGKYGRLNFEDYIAGLTPEEGFITDLGKMEATDTTRTPATTWMEIFGENTDDMRNAAMEGKFVRPEGSA